MLRAVLPEILLILVVTSTESEALSLVLSQPLDAPRCLDEAKLRAAAGRLLQRELLEDPFDADLSLEVEVVIRGSSGRWAIMALTDLRGGRLIWRDERKLPDQTDRLEEYLAYMIWSGVDEYVRRTAAPAAPAAAVAPDAAASRPPEMPPPELSPARAPITGGLELDESSRGTIAEPQLRVFAAAALGLPPGTAVGAMASVAWPLPHELQISGGYGFLRHPDFQVTERGMVSFEQVRAHVALCSPAAAAGPFLVRGCAAVFAGVIYAEGRSFSDDFSITRPMVEPEIGATIEAPLGDRVAFHARGGLLIPLIRDVFFHALDETPAEFYATPPVAAAFAVGLGVGL